MNFIIGVDLDHTIICYDEIFRDLLKKLGKKINTKGYNKGKFKKRVLKLGGLKRWHEFQALIYGKYIKTAKIFPGFYEFLVLSKIRKNKLYIISHKTKYALYNKKKILLRKSSLNWLKTNKIIETKQKLIGKGNVFYKAKKKDKISKIQELQCTHFIDDLKNVFYYKNFPKKTKKIFFSTKDEKFNLKKSKTFKSWRQISNYLYGQWKSYEITNAVNNFFFNKQIIKTKIVKGRGNSQIFKLFSKNKQNYCLKIYPDKQIDLRERQNIEFESMQYLFKRNFSVAKPIFKNEALNWSVFKWVEGSKVRKVDNFFINYSMNFIKKLKKISSGEKISELFPPTSEDCLNGSRIEEHINDRLKILKKQNNTKLNNFFKNSFNPSLKYFLEKAKNNLNKNFYSNLKKKYQILCDPDFGSHNGIKISKKKIVFIDFEYFGWDDPVRLICDSYWNPGMNLNNNFKKKWFISSQKIFNNDPSFNKRLENFLPLYGLRWCLIILNEFIKDRLQKKIDVRKKRMNKKLILNKQFKKSSALLMQINKLG